MKKKSFLLYILLIFTLFFSFTVDVFAKEEEDYIRSCKIGAVDTRSIGTSGIEGIEYYIVENYSPNTLVIYKMNDNNKTTINIKQGQKTYVAGRDFTDYTGFLNSISFDYSFKVVSDGIHDGYLTECPKEVKVKEDSDYKTSLTFSMEHNFLKQVEGSNGRIIDYDIEDNLKNAVDGKIDKEPSPAVPVDHIDVCSFVLPVLNWVKILVPILIILLSSMDFFKAVFANEDDAMKKAYGKLIKRLMIAVVIFLIPSLLEWLITRVFPEIFGKDKWFLEWCPGIK